MHVARLLALVAAAPLACGGSAQRATVPLESADALEAAPVPPALAQLAWLVGRWERPGGVETWAAAGEALFGVGFTVEDGQTTNWEVMIISAADGQVRLTAYPDGRSSARFPLVAAEANAATFANPEHDFPKRILYQRQGDQLQARIEGDQPDEGESWTWQRGAPAEAKALERADRDFAAAVAARRLDAWVEAFAPGGAMWRAGVGRVAAPEGVRDLMAPAFSDPSFRMEWEPLASGLSPAGDLGYTVGSSRVFAVAESGLVSERWRGAYVSVWQRQPDGRWQVLFDTGDPE